MSLPLYMVAGWTVVYLYPASRVYSFKAGARKVHDHLRDWFVHAGIDRADVLFKWQFLPSGVEVWFRLASDAMLFKLAWA